MKISKTAWLIGALALPGALIGRALFYSQLPLSVTMWLPMLLIGISALLRSIDDRPLPHLPMCGIMLLGAWCMGVDLHWHCFSMQKAAWWVACALFLIIIKESKRGTLVLVLGGCGVACALVKLALTLNFLPQSSGLFDNEAGYAAALTLSFPACLMLARQKKKVGIFFVVAVLGGFMVTNSRTAWLAAAVVGACWVESVKYHSYRIRRWQWFGLAGCFALLGCILWMLRPASALGRLYMNQVAAKLVYENPLAGLGSCGFRREYMSAQASCFSQHPEHDVFALLADNVPQAFNELLSWLLSYGVVGLLLLSWCCYKWFRPAFQKAGKDEGLNIDAVYVRSLLFGVVVLSLTSYPFAYPYSVLVLLSVTSFFLQTECRTDRKQRFVMAFSSVGVIGIAVLTIVGEMYWKKADRAGLQGQKQQTIEYYEHAVALLPNRDELLYNYAADLNAMGCYRESQEVMQRLSVVLDDYETELLAADNAESLRQYALCDKHLQKAHWMVPNRFFPLWSRMTIAMEQGDKHRATHMAREIVRKQVKVPSPEVEAMRKDAMEWLEGCE